MAVVTRSRINNVGFIATRLQGTDGVTLETAKWSSVLENMGYTCYFFAGMSDWDTHRTTVIPEAFFQHPQISEIQLQCFGRLTRSSQLSGEIHHLRVSLKRALYEFVRQYNIDLIIPENSLTIPMNIPLGVAITEFIAETGIPTIAHHHDFYWERQRFNINCIPDFLAMAFPPNSPSIRHVVINTPASQELSYRKGISSMVIPNVLDFQEAAPGKDDYNKDVREDFGLEFDDVFFLQPTRIVSRKGIEHSIEIINRLNNPKAKLVISHGAGDEGFAYENRILSYAEIMNVPLIVKPEIVGTKRQLTADGKKIYSLWDIYPYTDFVMYPSIYEGFGNALLETIYFKKPIVVNRYSIYEIDIEPVGFELIAMNGYATEENIQKITYLLDHPDEKERIVEKNYIIASQFFSYNILAGKLKTLLASFEGIA